MRLRILAALALLTLVAAPAAGARLDDRSAPRSGAPKPVQVQLLAINDFHGNLEPPSGSSGQIGTTLAGVG